MASGSGGVSDGGGSRSVSVVMTLSIVPCPGDCLDRATRPIGRRGLARGRGRDRGGHALGDLALSPGRDPPWSRIELALVTRKLTIEISDGRRDQLVTLWDCPIFLHK